MRFHVLGIGPIGSLVAFHLRRSLPAATHPVSLVVRTKTRARALRKGGGISVDHEGVSVVQGGFDIEVFDPVEEALHDFVYNKYDQMRLPASSDNPQAWRRRAADLSSMETAAGAGAADAVQTPIESIIVCTKAHSTLPAFHRIKARLSAASTVVLLQNGMGVYERLVADVFRNPLERPQFVLASTTHGARAKGHGDMVQTVHVSVGDVSFAVVPDPAGERDFERSKYDFRRSFFDRALSLDDIGPAPTAAGGGSGGGSSSSARPADRCATLRATVAALTGLGPLNAKWQTMEEMQIRLRRKLVVNAVINPLTALAQCSNGAIFGDRFSRAMTKKVCEEAAAVFAAEAAADARDAGKDAAAAAAAAAATDGKAASAPAGLRARDLQDEVFRICRLTSRNFSSMLQDTWRGQRTEVEYLNGHLHRLGAKFGVPTPCNDVLYDLIRMREGIVPAARL